MGRQWVALYGRECFDYVELDNGGDRVECVWVRIGGGGHQGRCHGGSLLQAHSGLCLSGLELVVTALSCPPPEAGGDEHPWMTPPYPLGALGHFPLMINKPLQQSYALGGGVSLSMSPLLCQCPGSSLAAPLP